MTALYVWAGQFRGTKADYWEYFYPVDKKEKPRFCVDTGMSWLDEDFIGYYFSEKTNCLRTAVEATPESGLYEKIFEACLEKGIKCANALFYWHGQAPKIKKDVHLFNGLNHIGQFEWE